MHGIEKNRIAQWGSIGKRVVPLSVDINCPNCDRVVNYSLREHLVDGVRNAVAATAACPGCRAAANFWSINGPDQDGTECQAVFMYPAPRVHKEPVPGTELLPPRIQREYRAAIQVYNAGVWTAFAAACRRLLEGLMFHALPNGIRARTLNEQLKVLPEHVDLVEPISRLAHGIRKVGNLGAHFDDERELDHETSELLMQQVEYLLEFLFALPLRIEQLERRIDRDASFPGSSEVDS